MTPTMRISFATRLILTCLWVLAVVYPVHAEWNETVLYSFQGGNSDGAVPVGGIVFDSSGNLYGATQQGGGQCVPLGCGIVFQLTPPAQKGDPWTETVLYIFKGVTQTTTDGAFPVGGLIMDKSGNLYGTTGYGGTGDCVLLGTKVGCGTVYEMSPPSQKGGSWTETILYSFQSGKDGYLPQGDLTFDRAGNLYGATIYGGGYGTCNAPYYQYCGTVFRLHPPKAKGGKWTEKVLYSFKGGTKGKEDGDGAEPNGGLVLDSSGAVYGTTFYGGNESAVCQYGTTGIGCGTVFALSPPSKPQVPWKEQILHRFRAQPDGDNPAAGLTICSKRNLYGTTMTGGPNGGGGTVFRLNPPVVESDRWVETILYGFKGNGDGEDLASPVIVDPEGDIYGSAMGSGGAYYGTIYQLQPPKDNGHDWTFTLLYGFTGPPDGGQPSGALTLHSRRIYGTTTQGGSGTECSFHGCGTLFEAGQQSHFVRSE